MNLMKQGFLTKSKISHV